MTRLDPALVGMLARRRAARGGTADMSAGRPETSPRRTPDTVYVMIKFTGEVADLEALDFAPLTLKRHPGEGWSIAAGPIPTDRLPDLDAVDHVVKVEASRPMRPELDRSLGEIKADQLHVAATPFKGAGVVVGIIDSGIDWAHHSFRKPDGTSRILAIWDQSLTAEGTESAPAAFPGIGVEYTKAHIDAALGGTGTVRTVDGSSGHGTHVAGIAAGDGSQPGNCSDAFTFVGVAPEADLIVVRNSPESEALGESINLAHALDYIWDHPAAAGKPVVINLSQGDNLGAHDGTALVEQLIDLELLLTDGHMIVKSAGNEGRAGHHAQVTLAAGASTDLLVHVGSGDDSDRHVEMWYPGDASVRCTVAAPALGAPPMSPSVDPGDTANWTVDPTLPANRRTVVRMDSRTNDPDNGDNSIHIEFDPASKAKIPAGEWRLRLANTGATPATVDAWIERGDGSPVFDDAVATRAGTISIPGTARRVITVGAYSQSGFLFFNWSGGIAGFSSRGPTRDGRIKPDISAPGVGITSAKAQVRPNCCCDCCRDFYTDKDGTSMAAPHVTGVVALMYQKNPTLDADAVRQHLAAGARVPDGLTPADLPNSDFGAGKVDAAAAVGAVPPPATPVEDPDDGDVDGDVDELTAARSGRAEPGDGRDEGSGPNGAAAINRHGQAAAPLLSMLHAALLTTPQGQDWAADVSRHFSQVRGLVNHNLRVAVAWHRMQGPALVAHLGHVAAGAPPGVALPALTVDELSRRFAAFLDSLERYGPPDLADTVRRRRPQLLALDLTDVARALGGDARPAA